jgi:hypothetical protein
MRYSTKWPNIILDGDVFIEGFLGLTWFPSAEAKAARDKWETEVDKVVTRLSEKTASWCVMNALYRSGKKLTIVPRKDFDCNSTTYPGNTQAAARSGTEAEHCSAAVKGTNAGIGGGTDSKIDFSPAQFATQGKCSWGGAGRDADEILCHELCHAMRYGLGQRNACFTSPAGWGDYEEFVAIVLTNVYSSETNRTLRKDHEGYVPLPTLSNVFNSKGEKSQVNLHDPQIFTNWFRPQLENLAKYQKPLTDYLAQRRHIKWNPFLYL